MEAAKLVGKTSQDAILQKRCHRNRSVSLQKFGHIHTEQIAWNAQA